MHAVWYFLLNYQRYLCIRVDKMVDQVHGLKLEDIEPVIRRPMNNTDIAMFRNVLVQSYNPTGDPKKAQKSDFKVEQDEKFLFFLMKTGKVDKEGNVVWRIIFKMRKFVEAKDGQPKKP